MKIEILGTGCPKCAMLTENARTAVARLRVDAEVGKVTDLMEITARGVMMTPALVIDGQIRAAGRVPTAEEIQKMLRQEGGTP